MCSLALYITRMMNVTSHAVDGSINILNIPADVFLRERSFRCPYMEATVLLISCSKKKKKTQAERLKYKFQTPGMTKCFPVYDLSIFSQVRIKAHYRNVTAISHAVMRVRYKPCVITWKTDWSWGTCGKMNMMTMAMIQSCETSQKWKKEHRAHVWITCENETACPRGEKMMWNVTCATNKTSTTCGKFKKKTWQEMNRVTKSRVKNLVKIYIKKKNLMHMREINAWKLF